MNSQITKIYPIKYDSYLKEYIIRFRVRCPSCLHILKHAVVENSLHILQYTNYTKEKECLNCHNIYQVNFNSKLYHAHL